MSWRDLSIDGSYPASFLAHRSDGTRLDIARSVAIETPIALEFNGIGYAVMMATPRDLDDFILGFALSERLIDHPAQLDAHTTVVQSEGVLLRANVAAACTARLMERVRHRTSDSSCGLCGIESLEQALRPLPMVKSVTTASDTAVFRALGALSARQLLNAQTGSVHAAALCSAEGDIIMVREDVGRHNAFDKLIGAMAHAKLTWEGGFALLSSRCSYELVEKAVTADCPMLVAISAPTSLALDRAAQAGLRLITLARPDSFLSSSP
jgi:FdhD protein